MEVKDISIAALQEFIKGKGQVLAEKLPGKYPGEQGEKLKTLFYNCFINTVETTLKMEDDLPFVITGDIPAMWLRDSAAQVRHYLPYMEESQELKMFIKGLVWRQFQQISVDPYANAFNATASGATPGYDDIIPFSPWVWERKYEVDSLCYAVLLLSQYYERTDDDTVFTPQVIQGLWDIINLWTLEQDHTQSDYVFIRENCAPSDTLSYEGKGAPVAYTGMTWSGFRPSDDACQYGYLVPSNAFASVVLPKVAAMATAFGESELASKATDLQKEIVAGIEEHAIVETQSHGKVYAYEVDGRGNHNFMDDANVPSLLSLPYLGYTENPEVSANTRRFILSDNNPYYYAGAAAKGIGSPHTPEDYIWHIALSMQGLTADTPEEKLEVLETILSTDGGTLFLHEGFHKDDATQFTREWFAWSNSLFAEFVIHLMEEDLL